MDEEPTTREKVAARLFTPQPATDEQRTAGTILRQHAIDFGAAIEHLVPDGRDKSIAMTALEDVLTRAHRGLLAGSPQ